MGNISTHLGIFSTHSALYCLIPFRFSTFYFGTIYDVIKVTF